MIFDFCKRFLKFGTFAKITLTELCTYYGETVILSNYLNMDITDIKLGYCINARLLVGNMTNKFFILPNQYRQSSDIYGKTVGQLEYFDLGLNDL